MGLKINLEKIEEVINYIIYSIHDISELWTRKSSVYTHPGGKVSLQVVSDKGRYTKLNTYSSNPAVATIDEDGYVYGHSVGTATVTLKNGNLSSSATVTVGASEVQDLTAIPEQDRIIDQMIIVNPRETLEVGDEYALYAVGKSNGLDIKYDPAYYNPIKWTSSNTEVAGMVFGTVMAYKPGTCTITASDLNNNASASFQLTVVPKYEPSATREETYIPDIDNSGETDVTVAIANALNYASANGYKMISFPKGKYLMNGDNRPNNTAIPLPSNMIIDFNGAEIHFDPNSNTVLSGYTMFMIENKENLWLRNLTVYGENETSSSFIRVEGNRSLLIGGNSKNIHIENCSFLWSPGFNVGLFFTHRNRLGFKVNSVVPNSVEAGGLDDYGNEIALSYSWRTTFRSVVLESGYWIVGNFVNYQMPFIRSRLYDILFYDSDKNVIFVKRDCYVHQKYCLPEGMVPAYCRLVINEEDEPTTYDAAFGGFAHICDSLNPMDIYFKDCSFKYAVSTGLSPQGGQHVVVDNCTFVDNGYQDPFSHIDWEDGRQNAQGCIVKNCTFKREEWGAITSDIINGYCRNVTFHDNYVYRSLYTSGSESVMQRCFNNIFEGDSVSISGKMDSIFAGNLTTAIPTISDGMPGTHTISVDNQIIT